MMRLLICFPLIAGAGCDGQRAMRDDSAENMVAWPKPNPDVDANTWKGVGSLECRPTRTDVCKPGGCTSGEPRVWQAFEPSTGTYKRCDEKGCDAYPAHVSYSGAWANIVVPDHAMLARITASSDYYEIVTQMDVALIYRGRCRRRP
jgi:hypothetical protein